MILFRNSKFPIIAVTGSIASGKSYFTKKLSQIRGVKSFSSDEMVHTLYADRNFAEKLIKIFGEGIANSSLHIRESGYQEKTLDYRLRWNESEPLINRQKLGEIVFKNPNKKKLLESLVYPELSRQRQEIIKLLNRQNFRGVLVFEIPLLFENNLENQFDFVITIFCNKIIQKQRVLERKNMSEEKFNNILKTQMTLSERLKKSDTSYNSGSHQLFITSFAELLKIITSVVR